MATNQSEAFGPPSLPSTIDHVTARPRALDQPWNICLVPDVEADQGHSKADGLSPPYLPCQHIGLYSLEIT